RPLIVVSPNDQLGSWIPLADRFSDGLEITGIVGNDHGLAGDLVDGCSRGVALGDVDTLPHRAHPTAAALDSPAADEPPPCHWRDELQTVEGAVRVPQRE